MSLFSRPLKLSSQGRRKVTEAKQLLFQAIHLSGSANNHRKKTKLEKIEGTIYFKGVGMSQRNSKREMQLGLRTNWNQMVGNQLLYFVE